jgi:predicted PurR-regulated permease PerM
MGGSTTSSHGHAPTARLGRVVGVGAALVLVGLLPLVAGLVGALALAVVLSPVQRRLARHLPARLSAFLLTFVVLVLVVGPGAWLVVATAREAGGAVRAVWQSGTVATLVARLQAVGLGPPLQAASTAVASSVPARAAALFGGATHAAVNLIVALFGLYYLLTIGADLWSRATRLLPSGAELAEALRARFVAVTEAVLLGTVLTAAIQGAIVGAGFALVGLPAPVFWGVVTAGVSVLPLLGSALVWLPGVASLLLGHRYGAAATLAVIGGVLASNLDNVVRLVLFRRVSGIHPMLTLVGAFAGMRVFGVAGALLGPLVLSFFVEMLDLHAETAARPARSLRSISSTGEKHASTT